MKEQTEEIKLVKQARKGKVEAYGELIHRYQEYLYRTAFLYTKNEDTALDMVQECVLKNRMEVSEAFRYFFFCGTIRIRIYRKRSTK